VREGPETVLAFIMEPISGLAAGATVAPDAYYGAVREICTRHGVKLIYDEVISGAGRTGRFLATDHWPEGRPDVVTLAKGVSAGYAPLGVLLAPETMAEELAASGGFMHGFTYVANPLSCAAGAATLAEVEERDLVGNAARMGAVLRAKLEALKSANPLVGDVRGRGLLMAIELVADADSKRMIPLELMAPYRLQQLGYTHGIALYCRRTSRGAYGDWLMTSPPLIVTEAEIGTMVERLAAVLDQYAGELRAQGVIG
jgi:adenosylmethionine-8-amino-7-oxononanoate aminotransferase